MRWVGGALVESLKDEPAEIIEGKGIMKMYCTIIL